MPDDVATVRDRAQMPRGVDSSRLTIVRHRLRPGESERQALLFERHAALQARFGEDLRQAYAAVASTTAMARGVDLIEVSEPDAKGWWVRPAGAATGHAILFIHGGGYQLGDATSYRGLASQIASRTRTAVFAMDYPLAPQYRFPAAHDAAEATLAWLVRRGVRQFSIIGDSAGGGLSLALLGASMSKIHRPASVVVFSPWTDLALTGQSFNDRTTHDPIFEPAVLAGLAHTYLDGADPRDGRASPLYDIPDDPPPIAIQVGSEELLLDDSRRYAEQAALRGGEIALDIFEGMHHVFQRDAGTLETADVALDLAAGFVTRHWSRN